MKKHCQEEITDCLIIAGVYGWIINEVAQSVYDWSHYVIENPQPQDIMILCFGAAYIIIGYIKRKIRKNKNLIQMLDENKKESHI